MKITFVALLSALFAASSALVTPITPPGGAIGIGPGDWIVFEAPQENPEAPPSYHGVIDQVHPNPKDFIYTVLKGHASPDGRKVFILDQPHSTREVPGVDIYSVYAYAGEFVLQG